MTRPGKFRRKRDSNSGPSAFGADASANDGADASTNDANEAVCGRAKMHEQIMSRSRQFCLVPQKTSQQLSLVRTDIGHEFIHPLKLVTVRGKDENGVPGETKEEGEGGGGGGGGGRKRKKNDGNSKNCRKMCAQTKSSKTPWQATEW